MTKYFKKNFMAPSYGRGSLSQGYRATSESLLFTIKSPGNPGTHFVDLGRMKG